MHASCRSGAPARATSPPPQRPPRGAFAKLAVSDSVNVSVIVKESIEERKLKFASTLKPYLLMYGADMLNDFYAYWTEHGDKDKKFRSEKETSFSVERRLETWKKNEKVFNKPQKADRL